MKKILKRILFLVLSPIALVILGMAFLSDSILWVLAIDTQKTVFDEVLNVMRKVIPDIED